MIDLSMKKIYSLWLAFMLAIICCQINLVHAQDVKEPEITAEAAIVIDNETGEVLYEKNADKRMYPASLTKMMTGILVLEYGNYGDIVTVSPKAADVECTRLWAGNKVREFDLMRQMLMCSDNGAATALGEHIAGSMDNFQKLMNETAQKLDMQGTHFVNANGMPDSNHYTTARDMSKLASYCMKNKLFRRVVGTISTEIPYVAPAGRVEKVGNSNDLLYDYPGTIGIKTGYTRAAGGCLASAVQKNGHEMLAIVLHSDFISDDQDCRFTDSIALYEYCAEKYYGNK